MASVTATFHRGATRRRGALSFSRVQTWFESRDGLALLDGHKFLNVYKIEAAQGRGGVLHRGSLQASATRTRPQTLQHLGLSSIVVGGVRARWRKCDCVQ